MRLKENKVKKMRSEDVSCSKFCSACSYSIFI